MTNLLNQFADGWFSWQVAMLWQVGILIVIVAAADFVLRKWAWPQVRYALWLLILVKLVLPPSLTSPASFTAEIPLFVSQTIKNTEYSSQNTEVGIEDANLKYKIQNTKMDSLFQGNDNGHGDDMGEILPRGLKPTLQAKYPENIISWKVYALCVWAFGAVLLTLWLVFRLYSLRREHFKCELKLPTELENLLQETAQRVGLKNVPQIILTDKICCPAVFGVFKPVLLLPADKLKDMTSQDAEHIFLHELSHIKRGDLLVHAFYMLLQIAYWFNPLLWLIRRHIQNLRELCCDAAVARILKEKTAAYRQTLLETARRLVAEPVDPGLGLLGLFENSGRLIDRLRWLEKKSWKYRPLRIATVFILICVMSACVLPMAQRNAAENKNEKTTLATEFTEDTEIKKIKQADFVIKGRVTDSQTGKPIAGAKVGDVNEYAEGKFFTTTDANGDYSYKTYYEEHNIKCSATGYKSKNETLLTKFFGSEKEKVINFQLAAEDSSQAEIPKTAAGHTTAEVEAMEKAVQDYAAQQKAQNAAASGDSNTTPLHLAVMGNHQEMAEMLISKGADVNVKDSDGNTPLHLAVSNGSPEMCEFLISKGADLNAKNAKGRMPLDLASAGGHRQTAELLIAKGAVIKGLNQSDIRNKDYIPENSIVNDRGGIADKIDVPFEDDPQVIGQWQSVDFVEDINDFLPGKRQWAGGELFLKGLVILPDGKTFKPWWTWTKGFIFHSGDKTAGKYVIKEMAGTTYMFFEWKSGGYTIRAKRPAYYVLKKVPSQNDIDKNLPVELKAFDEWSMNNFRNYLDCGDNDAVGSEEKMLQKLNNRKSEDYYKAINALACMRSQKAVPMLAAIAFSRQEKDNRDRWMATRALGLIGDKETVGDLIHLLYHYNNNTRLYARVSLIRLGCKDLGPNWRKWALWYRAKIDSRFSTKKIEWTKDKKLADENLQKQKDQEWLKVLKDDWEIKNKYSR